MSLYQVAAPVAPAAQDINQLVNLLTGVTPAYLGAQVNVATTISASLPGATAASRFVGGTASMTGPTSGTFQTGDWLINSFWECAMVCTAGGTPGTWTQVGSGAAGILIMLQSGSGQTLTPRSGHTGFDVITLDEAVGPHSGLLYSPNFFGWVAPYPCTIVVDSVMQLVGPASGPFDCAAYVLQNGVPVLFGDEFPRGQAPVLGVSGLIRVNTGDIIQLACYTEGAYATYTGFLGMDISIMGS